MGETVGAGTISASSWTTVTLTMSALSSSGFLTESDPLTETVTVHSLESASAGAATTPSSISPSGSVALAVSVESSTFLPSLMVAMAVVGSASMSACLVMPDLTVMLADSTDETSALATVKPSDPSSKTPVLEFMPREAALSSEPEAPPDTVYRCEPVFCVTALPL